MEMKLTKVGSVRNYYGGIVVMENNSKYYYGIKDFMWDALDWENAKKIEDLDDEFDTQRIKYESEKQKLLNLH
jgi:hypothetical protein